MNLFHIKSTKPVKETDQLDDSDCSDLWSLPSWPALQQARLNRDRKMARLKRLRRMEQRKLEMKDASSLASEAVGSTGNLGENDEKDDLPEDMQERGQWNNSCEFLLSIISMSVGMGNFYRFPFIAYENGGGVFLIPYLIVMTIIGRPLFLLELAIGQFCSYGQVRVWDMVPFFRGVGYGAAIGCFYVVTYYSAAMGIAFYYLFVSFQQTLPWSLCDPKWAGETTCAMIRNVTSHKNCSEEDLHKAKAVLPELYYERQVTAGLDNIDNGIGYPLGIQTLCLLASWLVIYGIIVRGVESSGKAAYITTIYPFVIIILCLVLACTKEGSGTGILYFILPKWHMMFNVNVWFNAIEQCFFTLSLGFGPIITYASFNPFHHNIYKDAMVVSVMDTVASLLAGFAVFATMGHLAFITGQPVESVVSVGPGLVFSTFTGGMIHFDYFPYSAQIISVLFFIMLLTLAAGSAAAWQLAVISILDEKFKRVSKFWITTGTCTVCFLVSLIYTTPGGQFITNLVDKFGGNLNIYLLATLEIIGVAWAYGLKNVVVNIEFMLNKKVNWYWRICWGYLIPVTLIVVLIYALITQERLQYNHIPYPDAAIVCGWLLTLLSVLPVPIVAAYEMWHLQGSLKERFLRSLKPIEDFGPRNPTDKERWKLYKRGILVNGGPGPDTYKLPEGETKSNNTVSDWLTVLGDGTVVPKKEAEVSEELENEEGNTNFINNIRTEPVIGSSNHWAQSTESVLK